MDVFSITAASSFLIAIGLQEPAKQIGHLLTEEIRLWQFKNQTRLFEKAQKHCQIKGISPKAIPKSFLIPLIESAKNEDNESLQNMWAALLGNAAIAEPVHPSYIGLIKNLSGFEAKILRTLMNEFKLNGKRYFDKNNYETLIEKQLTEMQPEESVAIQKGVILINLARLDFSTIRQERNNWRSSRNRDT